MVEENASESTPRFPPIVSVMDVADLQELLSKIPDDKKVKIYEKMIIALSEYHRKCHESQLLLAEKLDRIIRSVD